MGSAILEIVESVGTSVMGQERTLVALDFMSAFGGKADEIVGKADIGLVVPDIALRGIVRVNPLEPPGEVP